MKFTRPHADVFIPLAGQTPTEALAGVTHLCIAAHQDDIEIMAHAGICDCLEAPSRCAFGGVVVTNGAGSPRRGAYAHFTDEQMQEVRRNEQRQAAQLGHYAIQVQLAYPSADVKAPGHPGLAADLDTIFGGCQPETVYLHNPADKHDTHVAVLVRCIEALRRLPATRWPKRVFGCEVWRDLDWLAETDKILLDSGRQPELSAAMLNMFASQVAGGKRYDLATCGRRLAHATYHNPHSVDHFAGITLAVDLMPLLVDSSLSMGEFAQGLIDRFRQDVWARVAKFA
jgi:LmbE family N-acetylglucosaminyl deacetylase